MTIRDIQGENVEDAMGLLRVSIGHLGNMNKIPIDLIKQFFTIFQMTSMDKFNRLLENVESTIQGRAHLGPPSFIHHTHC